MASAEAPERVIHRFASLLDTAGIPYMLTGSFASGFHGAPRATQDIDIVISPNFASLKRFLNALAEDQYYVSQEAALGAYGRESLFNVIDFASGWKLDLICRKSRPFSVCEFERRAPQQLAGMTVYVTSAEDVVLSKLEWGKLSQSERQLEDAAGIVRIQGGQLDVEYIRDWVERLGLRDGWKKVEAMAG
ncbi:hypothetical protein ACFL5O_10110 [Myxococcota bacterium]